MGLFTRRGSRGSVVEGVAEVTIHVFAALCIKIVPRIDRGRGIIRRRLRSGDIDLRHRRRRPALRGLLLALRVVGAEPPVVPRPMVAIVVLLLIVVVLVLILLAAVVAATAVVMAAVPMAVASLVPRERRRVCLVGLLRGLD